MANTQISVEEIMQRIREEVRRRKAQRQQRDVTIITSLTERDSLEAIRLPLSIPEQYIEIKDSYHVNELLVFHDAEFVRNAYRAILRREPDPEGYEYYLNGLRGGRFSKIEILARLRYSPEGRQKGVKIKGLFLPFGIKYLKRIPIVGYITGTLAGIVNLNTITKNIETFEAFVNKHFTEYFQRQQQMLSTLESEINKIIEQINQKTELISLIQAQLERQKGEITELLEERLREIREAIAERVQKEEIQAQLERQKGEITELLESRVREIDRQLRDHKLNIIDQQRRITLLLEEARKRLPEPISQEQIKNMLAEEDHLLNALYVSLEDRFRGTREDIKERLKIYLPYVRETLEKVGGGLVLDVGCGRGEWLELLKGNGIEAIGVDINRVMIDQCKELDLNVIEADAIEYLRQQKNNTLAIITGFHIVEHLPLKKMIALFDECLRVLKPGGMVIFETPNPENILVGACYFYLDPTHKNPIPKELLHFLLEERGFNHLSILINQPTRDEGSPDYYFDAPKDYALLGYKP